MVKFVAKIVSMLVIAVPAVYSQVCDPAVSKFAERDPPRLESLKEIVKIIHGKVVFVIDGDSITVLADDGTPYPVRVYGIDAPDLRQPFGLQSADRLGAELMGKDVTLISHHVDQRGRYYCDVFLQGEDVGLGQVVRGMAWVSDSERCSERFDRRSLYASTETNAKTEKRGLWQDPNPLPPWYFQREDPGRYTAVTGAIPASPSAAQNQVMADGSLSPNPSNTANPKDRKHFLGPRGGCYYINERNVRVYVGDKSLCEK